MQIELKTINNEARADSRDIAQADFQQPSAYTLLAAATQAALNGEMVVAAELIRTARLVATPDQQDNVQLLSSAVVGELGRVAKGRRPSRANPHNEFRVVHFWFRNNMEEVIQGGQFVKVSRVVGYNPDFMVSVAGECRPVECKLTFNARALNQLLAYLSAYGAGHGYAVGIRLTCKLPDNITFIQCPLEARHD